MTRSDAELVAAVVIGWTLGFIVVLGSMRRRDGHTAPRS